MHGIPSWSLFGFARHRCARHWARLASPCLAPRRLRAWSRCAHRLVRHRLGWRRLGSGRRRLAWCRFSLRDIASLCPGSLGIALLGFASALRGIGFGRHHLAPHGPVRLRLAWHRLGLLRQRPAQCRLARLRLARHRLASYRFGLAQHHLASFWLAWHHLAWHRFGCAQR